MAIGENKPNNVIGIPTTIDKLFRYWVEFLKPLHHLTDREMDVIIMFLKKRYELSKSIIDQATLNRFLMSEEIKAEIRDACGVSPAHFQVIMGKLRKNKVIIDGNIFPKFIPNIKETDDAFQLLLYFPIINESQK